MDAQARRERRQAKIKAAGANRLAKITKTTNPDAEDFKAPPGSGNESPISNSPSPSQSQSKLDPMLSNNSNDEDPPESVPEADSQYRSMPNNSEMANDPLFQMLSQMQSNQSGPGANGDGALPDMSDPFQAFNTFMTSMSNESSGSTAPGTGAAAPHKAVSGNQLFWTLAHVMSVLILTLYSLFSDQQLVFRFCTLEIILHTSRFLLEKGSPPADSTLVSLAQYIPEPFKGYVIFGARYIRIGNLLIQDTTLCLFVIGISSFVS